MKERGQNYYKSAVYVKRIISIIEKLDKQQNAEEKQCYYCQKRLIHNNGFVCMRCRLEGKNIGKEIIKNAVSIQHLIEGV